MKRSLALLALLVLIGPLLSVVDGGQTTTRSSDQTNNKTNSGQMAETEIQQFLAPKQNTNIYEKEKMQADASFTVDGNSESLMQFFE